MDGIIITVGLIITLAALIIIFRYKAKKEIVACEQINDEDEIEARPLLEMRIIQKINSYRAYHPLSKESEELLGNLHGQLLYYTCMYEKQMQEQQQTTQEPPHLRR